VVSHAIAVVHSSSEDVRDSLDPAVGVPRETGQIVFWNIIAEVIEKEKRIEVGRVAEAESTAQVHASAF
jgi:hypothetical protein